MLAGATLLAGCGRAVPVDGPFYLDYIEDRDAMALMRCPTGPRGGCAIDGLPSGGVFAAGANPRYIAVARHPGGNRAITEYFYFARIAEERRGWGLNPERIVGPLSQPEFDAAARRLGLPELTVRIHGLE